MKNSILLAAWLLIGLYPCDSQTLRAQDRFVSVEELAAKHHITTKFKGKGGYSGPCVTLTIENTTADTAFVWIEPGRRLDNPDSGAQDILIVKEQKIKLLPHQTQTADVFGFCCQAGNRGPAAGTEFGIGQMAGGNLQWIATFLNAHPFDVTTIQQTVWVFSDSHSAASIVSNKDPKIQSLRKAVAERLNIVIPWYDIHYKKEANQLFSGKYIRLTGDVSFRSNTNGFILVNVRKDNGLLMTTVANDMGVYGHSYSYPVDISIENWATGKYYVNVYLDGNLRQRQEFVL